MSFKYIAGDGGASGGYKGLDCNVNREPEIQRQDLITKRYCLHKVTCYNNSIHNYHIVYNIAYLKN